MGSSGLTVDSFHSYIFKLKVKTNKIYVFVAAGFRVRVPVTSVAPPEFKN